MHSDLIIHFSRATQDEIARKTAERSHLRSSFSKLGRVLTGRQPRPSHQGGMLLGWRLGSPARGS